MRLIWAIIFLLGAGRVFGLPFASNFTVENGLRSNSVYSIAEDSLGFIWAATDNGVSRISSYGLTSFTSADGLTNNIVTGIMRDKNGTMWFDCFTAWPCFWDGRRMISMQDSLQLGKEVQFRRSYFDYLQSEFYGVYRDSCTKTYIHNFTTGEIWETEFQVDMVFSIYSMGNKKYVNVSARTFQVINGKLRPEEPGLDKYCFRFPILRMFDGNRKVIFTGVENEIILNKLTEGKPIPYDTLYTPGPVTNFCEASWGSHVVAGKQVFERKGNRLKLIFEGDGNARFVFVDSGGNIWIATVSEGVFLLREGGRELLSEEKGTERFTGMKINRGKLHVISEKRLWYLEEGQLKEVELPETPAGSYPGRRLLSANGGSLAITTGDGFFHIGQEQAVFRDRELEAVKYAVPLEHNKVLTGSYDQFFQYDLQREARTDLVWYRRARTIVPQTTHRMLLVGMDSIKVYDTRKRAILDSISLGNLDAIGANANYVVALRENQILLLDKHLKLLGANRDFLQKREANGLPIIGYRVYIDPEDRLYLATNQGWYRFQIDAANGNLVLQEKGLPTEPIGMSEVVETAVLGEKLYILEPKRLLSRPLMVTPDSIRSATCAALVAGGDRRLRGDWSEIPRTQNDIAIQVDFVSHKHQQRIPFDYQLQGLTDRWTRASGNELKFPGLPPGTYQLRVRPKPNAGRTEAVFTVATFTVLPYLYETTVFQVLAVLVLALSLVLLTTTYYRRRNRKAQEKMALQQEISDLRLGSLRAKMNPHFIFNSLNSIQQYFLQDDVRAGNRFLTQFASLIRETLHNSFHASIPLEDEIRFLENYLSLEKMRLQKRMDYQVEVDPALGTSTFFVPQMLIQPHVENAVQHGLGTIGKISLTFRRQQDQLLVTVEDNGIGIRRSLAKKGEKRTDGLSSAISNQRIDLLRRYYQAEFTLTIVDKSTEGESGTRVTISIPSNLYK